MNWLIGCRNLERIWLMKVLQKSFEGTQSKEVKTLPIHLMNFQWSREQKWKRVWVSTVFSMHFPKDPICDICLKTKIKSASCRRCTGTIVPRAEPFAQQITKFSVKNVNRETIIDMPWWYKTWQYSGYKHTHVQQKLPRRPRRTSWSSWSRRGNQKSSTLDNSLEIRQVLWRNYPGINVRQHHTDRKHMGLPKEPVRRVKEGTSAGAVAIRSEWKLVGRFHGMLVLSAKYSGFFRLVGRHQIRKAVRNAFQRTSNTVWSNGRISPYFCDQTKSILH